MIASFIKEEETSDGCQLIVQYEFIEAYHYLVFD
jgi:hypothetical protein